MLCDRSVAGFTNNWLFNALARIPALVHSDAASAPLTIDLLATAAAALRPAIIDTVRRCASSFVTRRVRALELCVNAAN
jgi:hypothetical protein